MRRRTVKRIRAAVAVAGACLVGVVVPGVASAASYSVVKPTANGELKYLGLGGGTPTFTWGVEADRRGVTQSPVFIP